MAWTSIGNIKGPTGAAGATGATGPAGSDASVTAATVGYQWYQPGYITGQYYFCNSPNAAGASTVTNNFLRLSPWTVTASITITRLFAEFTVAGEANSVLRVGIYADGGDGRPSTLVLDAGTISTGTGNAGTVSTGGTPGMHEITVSKALTPGLYWVGGAVQGASTTQPTIRTTNVNTMSYPIPLGATLPSAGATAAIMTAGNISGALPATLTNPGVATVAPRIGFKI